MDTSWIVTLYPKVKQGVMTSVWQMKGGIHCLLQLYVYVVQWKIYPPPEEIIFWILLSKYSWPSQTPLQELCLPLCYRPGIQHSTHQRCIQWWRANQEPLQADKLFRLICSNSGQAHHNREDCTNCIRTCAQDKPVYEILLGLNGTSRTKQ